MALIDFTDNGLYCSAADAFIDPWKPVQKAVITHGHSDHARWGHQQYITSEFTKPIVQYRIGTKQVSSYPYGKTFSIRGVKFSFHPAGHIVGSAQVRVEYKGEVWVVSGDYKTEEDQLTASFEPISCHSFITECTFGLPIYKWKNHQTLFDEVNEWWSQNVALNRTSILLGYSLGKAQRLLSGIDSSIGPIYTHGAVENLNEVIRTMGFQLPVTANVTQAKKSELSKALIIAPPSAFGSPWMKRFKSYQVASASGWMQLRGSRRRRGVDRGFVISDHADWNGLNDAIIATNAERVFVTHGYTEIFNRWLQERGFNSSIVSTEYGQEEQQEVPETENENQE